MAPGPCELAGSRGHLGRSTESALTLDRLMRVARSAPGRVIALGVEELWVAFVTDDVRDDCRRHGAAEMQAERIDAPGMRNQVLARVVSPRLRVAHRPAG